MKLQMNQIHHPIRVGKIIFSIVLLVAISSCAATMSNLGRTAPKNQVLPLAADESTQTQERVWQTKDMEVIYKTIKTGNTFTVEGSLSINDSITRTFPYMKWLKFSINYLDEDNKVISTDQININTGYRNKLAKNLKLINVPEAPPAAVSLTFSYWGLMTSPSSDEGSQGDWEIYFDPFQNNDADQKSAGNGLFYAD